MQLAIHRLIPCIFTCIAADIVIMATRASSSMAITKSHLLQLPKQAEMVMTNCWFPKEPVTTSGLDPAEADVPSSTEELPVQQTSFLVGELVTGQVTHHCKM